MKNTAPKGLPVRRLAPRFDLIPTRGLERLAARYELGLHYGPPGTWKTGLDERDTLNHGLAHLLNYRDRLDRFLAGERPDPRLADDDLAALAWSAMTLMFYQETGGKK